MRFIIFCAISISPYHGRKCAQLPGDEDLHVISVERRSPSPAQYHLYRSLTRHRGIASYGNADLLVGVSGNTEFHFSVGYDLVYLDLREGAQMDMSASNKDLIPTRNRCQTITRM